MLSAGERKTLKARAAGLEREAREPALLLICEKTGAEPVQQVGRVFVIFRQNATQ